MMHFVCNIYYCLFWSVPFILLCFGFNYDSNQIILIVNHFDPEIEKFSTPTSSQLWETFNQHNYGLNGVGQVNYEKLSISIIWVWMAVGQINYGKLSISIIWVWMAVGKIRHVME